MVIDCVFFVRIEFFVQLPEGGKEVITALKTVLPRYLININNSCILARQYTEMPKL